MRSAVRDVNSLRVEGVEALQRGDAARARGAFERAIAAGGGDAGLHIGLAYACRAAGDIAAGIAAAERALELDPRNVRALLLKADHLSASGDVRGAVAFYSTAVRNAMAMREIPSDLAREVERARIVCERSALDFERSIRERVGNERLADPAAARFGESLEILAGRKEPNVQRPRYYYFPGLAAIAFHDRAAFPFLDAVEAATPVIKSELLEAMRAGPAFQPYIQSDPSRPRREQDGLLDNPDWSALYLWKDGAVVPDNAARFPQTMRVLEQVPLCRAHNRSPSVLFSQLRPGAHIPPHTGMVNTRLIGHLPLVVPPGCTFRVGNETREWVEGKAWIFDDTIEHEAWNRSPETRVILLFEIWSPELTQRERELVNAMFEAIDAVNGRPVQWEI